MKNKKLILLLVSLLLVFAIPIGIKADSGWDSSYDSGGGGSWSSGDSWSGGGSWSSGDSWSSSGSSDYDLSTGESLIIFLGFIIFIVLLSLAMSKGKFNNGNYTTGKYNPSQLNNYEDVNSSVLEEFNIDGEAFKNMVYSKYVNIQNAWTDFDYEKLSTLLTDELYNSYVMQLDALKIKKEKNIMTDFKYINSKIISVKEENGIINISLYLNVEMYDYVVDKDNKVVRGTDKNKINIEYIVTFVKSSNETKNKKDVICPNCGAKVKAVAGGSCSYCGSKVIVDAKDYVMSKKTAIGQRRA